MSRIITICAVLVAVAAGAMWMMGRGAAPGADLPLAANAQQAADVDISGIVEMTQGAEDAPVTIVEYASFTCPHCANFHTGAYKQLKADYIDAGKVKFIYREVYFDKYGLWASMIARCAGPDRFFGMADLIYSGQSEWSRAGGATEIAGELRKIGRLAGMDEDALEVCLMDGDKARALVAWYQINAEADGVTSTPSFVMNGTKVENMAYESFAALIDAELAN